MNSAFLWRKRPSFFGTPGQPEQALACTGSQPLPQQVIVTVATLDVLMEIFEAAQEDGLHVVQRESLLRVLVDRPLLAARLEKSTLPRGCASLPLLREALGQSAAAGGRGGSFQDFCRALQDHPRCSFEEDADRHLRKRKYPGLPERPAPRSTVLEAQRPQAVDELDSMFSRLTVDLPFRSSVLRSSRVFFQSYLAKKAPGYLPQQRPDPVSSLAPVSGHRETTLWKPQRRSEGASSTPTLGSGTGTSTTPFAATAGAISTPGGAGRLDTRTELQTRGALQSSVDLLRRKRKAEVMDKIREAAGDNDVAALQSHLATMEAGELGFSSEEVNEVRRILEAARKCDSAPPLTTRLTTAEAEEAHRLVTYTEPDSTVVTLAAGVFGSDLPILGEHFHTLSKGQWLCDEVINAFVFLILERDKAKCAADAGRKPVHLFNSFFFTKLLEPEGRNGYSHAAVKRWSKKVKRVDGNIFRLSKLIIPVNVSNVHWTCAAVDFERKSIQYHDSMGGRGTEYVQALRQYLVDEAAKFPEVQMNVDEWTLQYGSRQDPQQNNGSDCGVFTCAFAFCLCEDKPLAFSASDMVTIRKRLALIIQAASIGRIDGGD